MFRILCLSIIYTFFVFPVFTTEINDVENFFKNYIASANSYSSDYFDYYTENPKIIRVVEKPDGTKVPIDVPFSRYKQEAKKSSKLAKLRRYKNFYSNIKILKYGNDYKITAMRTPSTSDYGLPSHFVVGEDINGQLKIKEESMNTRVQFFLKGS